MFAHFSTPLRCAVAVVALHCCSAAQATTTPASITVDGHDDEAFWSQAQTLDQFVTVEPFTQQTPALTQTVKLQSLPQGLAVFFTVAHPADVARTKPQTQRDQVDAADRVNLIVDFDGKGQTAYNFTVSLSASIEDGIVSRNQWRSDWDGDWFYAVSESAEQWTVELLIPWTIAAMEPVEGDTRRIGLYLDRVLKSRGERYAFPAVRFSQSDFVARFAPIDITAFSSAQSHLFPYVSVMHDKVHHDTKTRAGLDWFYKPSNHFQLIGSLNPDFGQVESDDLVIDFSATEVFFSDKRPFFTENNDDFNLPLPDDGQLVYTRRIGNRREDGNGIADIDAAVKWRAANEQFSLAYLGAQEADYHDDIGRRFQIVRPRYQWQQTHLGYALLRTDSPFSQRQADVHAIDIDSANWQALRVRAQMLRSHVVQTIENDRRDSSDDGQWMTVDYTPSVASQHTMEYLHYDRDLQLRDLGYVQRSDLRQTKWQSKFLHTDFAASNIIKEMNWTIAYANRHNNDGRDLGAHLGIENRLRNQIGDQLNIELLRINAGIDDQIARGYGVWARDSRYELEAGFSSARRGNGAWEVELNSGNEGLHDNFYGAVLAYKHFFGETFNTEFKTYYFVTPDWLYWQHDNVFAHYQRTRDYHLAFAFNWFPFERQEWRLKTQWASTVATRGQRYDLIAETMQDAGLASDDLVVNTFGLQLRYRYRLGNLSDVFVVYSRGGYRDDNTQRSGPGDLLGDALRLRDADQLLVKWRMQF